MDMDFSTMSCIKPFEELDVYAHGMGAGWKDLPMDLLGDIVSRLHFFDDFLALALSCKAWHQFVTSLEKEIPSLPPVFPWLMLAEENNDEEDGRRGFYSLFDGKVYQLKLPEACSKVCVGASYGWLLTIDIELDINLLHPFSRRKIGLPPLPASVNNYVPDFLYEVHVRKVVMSTNPWKPSSASACDCDRDYNCIVFVIYGHKWLLGFTSIDYDYNCDAAWTTVPTHHGMYDDIICYNGEFYAVNSHALLYICELNGYQNAKATLVPVQHPVEETTVTAQKYLVESSGDLLLVLRHRAGPLYNESEEEKDGIAYYTAGFTVLRLNKHTSSDEAENKISYDWEKVDSLGGRALFLGSNSSVSLASSDYNGCFKSNCIYFTDDCEYYFGTWHEGGGNDMGIFSMEDGTISPHYTDKSLSQYCPPLWYI